MIRLTGVAISLILAISFDSQAQVIQTKLDSLDGVGIDEKLGNTVSVDVKFRDSKGHSLTIGDVLDRGRPLLLSLNYSDCPMLCRLQLNGLIDGLREMRLEPGKDFEVVSISIDPLETPTRARQTKQIYVAAYGRPGTADGWHFLCGDKASIAAVAESVGFRFKYVPERKEYAHAAATIAVTPGGTVSRYLYGVMYPPQTLRLALVEAGEGKVGNTLDRVLLFCFHYDAASGRYAPVARRMMQLGASATITAMVVGLLPIWLRRMKLAKSTEVVSDGGSCND